MKAVNLASLTKKLPMDARQSATLIINSLIAEIEEGTQLLSMDEMIAIRDNKHKNTREYNRLIDLHYESLEKYNRLDHVLSLYESTYFRLQYLLADYLKLFKLWDLINEFEYLRDYDNDFGKNYNKWVKFFSSSLIGLGGILTNITHNSSFEDLKYISIMPQKEEILSSIEKLKTREDQLSDLNECIAKNADELGIPFVKEKSREQLEHLEKTKTTLDILLTYIHFNYDLASLRDPKTEAIRKHNLQTYKQLTKKDRDLIDQYYPDYKTELTELDEELELCELWEKKDYHKIVERVLEYKGKWYANIDVSKLEELDGELEEISLNWLENGGLEEQPSLFMQFPGLRKRCIKVRDSIEVAVDERLVEYDGFLQDLTSQSQTQYKNNHTS